MQAFALRTAESHWVFMFGDGLATMDSNGWESDARMIYAELMQDGLPSRVILIQGTFVRFRGRTLHESATLLASFIWLQNTDV